MEAKDIPTVMWTCLIKMCVKISSICAKKLWQILVHKFQSKISKAVIWQEVDNYFHVLTLKERCMLHIFSATFICCKFLPTHCLGMPYGDLYSLNFKFFLLICKKSLNINLNKYKWYLSWQVYLMTSLFFYMLHLHFHDNYLYNIKKNNHLSTKLISIIFNVHVPIYNVVYNQTYVYLHLIKK